MPALEHAPSPAGAVVHPAGALRRGTLVRRYKRFLADIVLDGLGPVAVHCPNSGSMMGLSSPGMDVLVSEDRAPHRKLPFTWEFVSPDAGATWVGCNTMRPNQVVGALLRGDGLPGIPGEAIGGGPVTAEVALGANSRIDFRLAPEGAPVHWVEVKNTTLAAEARDGARLARFPDAVTDRGARHLAELARRSRRGERATTVFFVNRADCDAFAVAADIDPAYARAYRAAERAGVRMLALGMSCGPDGWRVRGELPRLG